MQIELQDDGWSAVPLRVQKLRSHGKYDGPVGLVGYRNSGKQATAKWLADQMGRKFQMTSTVFWPEELLASTAALLRRSAKDWTHLTNQLVANGVEDNLLLYVSLPKNAAIRRNAPIWARPLDDAMRCFHNLQALGCFVVIGIETETDAVSCVEKARFVSLPWSQAEAQSIAGFLAPTLQDRVPHLYSELGGHPELWRGLIDCVRKEGKAPTNEDLRNYHQLMQSPFRGWFLNLIFSLRDRSECRSILDKLINEEEIESQAPAVKELESLGVLLTVDELPDHLTRKAQPQVRPIVKSWRRGYLEWLQHR